MTDEEIAARKSIAKKLNEEIEAAGVKAADEGGDPVIKMMEVLCALGTLAVKAADEGGDPVIKMMEVLCRHIIDVEARLNCL